MKRKGSAALIIIVVIIGIVLIGFAIRFFSQQASTTQNQSNNSQASSSSNQSQQQTSSTAPSPIISQVVDTQAPPTYRIHLITGPYPNYSQTYTANISINDGDAGYVDGNTTLSSKQYAIISTNSSKDIYYADCVSDYTPDSVVLGNPNTPFSDHINGFGIKISESTTTELFVYCRSSSLH